MRGLKGGKLVSVGGGDPGGGDPGGGESVGGGCSNRIGEGGAMRRPRCCRVSGAGEGRGGDWESE